MTDVYHLSRVSDFLLSKRIKITAGNEWLLGCCNYYSSIDPHGNVTNLNNFVYEQWLLADLREIGEGTFPPNLNQSEKMYLEEEYALQVDVTLNVAESCYSQLQKIKNLSTIDNEENNNNAQRWEPKVNRVLKLICTDGVQTLYAMEYQHIPLLHEPFIPGFKILVTGPVECRRGILLLAPSNVQVLGGEADNLIEENSKENVLANALNLKADANIFSKNITRQVQIKANDGALGKESESIPLSADDTKSHICKYQAAQNGFAEDEDDLFLSDQLTQVENQLHRNGNQYSCTMRNSSITLTDTPFKNQFINHRFEESDDNSKSRSTHDFSNKKERIPIIGIACPIVSANNSCKLRPSPLPNCQNECFDQRNAVIYPVGNNNTTISTENFDSDFVVSALVSMIKKQSNSGRIYRCCASVDKLSCKPRIKNDMWQVKVDIIDHTGVLEVSFSNAFLEKIFGYSAAEVLSQKERMKLNLSVKERIDQIVKIGAEKILSLHGRFVLKQSTNENSIEVIDVKQTE